ncbi:hypothetical protein TNCV_3333181 [Trichonephila clavipes]|nr:hypothetical protein TNCV_3333181 [Trichonephila clavipes]
MLAGVLEHDTNGGLLTLNPPSLEKFQCTPLVVDLIILSLGQVTKTTPELAALPLQTTTPRQREDLKLDIINVHHPPLHSGHQWHQDLNPRYRPVMCS